MKKELDKRKLEQVCRLTGKAVESAATFDKNEPPPPECARIPGGGAGGSGR